MLAEALGGPAAPVGRISASSPYIGLDFFLLDLLGSAVLFIFIEKLYPCFQAVFDHANVSASLGPLRYVVVTPNFHHWHHSQDAEAIDKNYAAHFAFLDHLFGTAVQSLRKWPDRYGVVGDYVPLGFVRQLAFPFLPLHADSPTRPPGPRR